MRYGQVFNTTWDNPNMTLFYLWYDDDAQWYMGTDTADAYISLPRGKFIASYNKETDTIEIRLKGSRKNIISFKSSALHTDYNNFNTQEEALNYITNSLMIRQ